MADPGKYPCIKRKLSNVYQDNFAIKCLEMHEEAESGDFFLFCETCFVADPRSVLNQLSGSASGRIGILIVEYVLS